MKNAQKISESYALSPKDQKSIARAGRLHWVHWLIVGLSLLLTLLAWHFSRTQLYEKNKNQFEYESQQVVGGIVERMQKYEDALWSGVAAIHSQSHSMDHAEWKRFADKMNIDKKYPGINGIGVIKHIPLNGAEDYLSAERKLRPDFKIHPAHDASELMPIIYIEPVETNRAAVGLDMAHEKNRYTAAIRARDSGTSQITGPITLVQDSEKTPGFLFYAPYYDGDDIDTTAARREQFIGMVYAPFIMNKLMDKTLAKGRRRVSIHITDGAEILYSEFPTTYGAASGDYGKIVSDVYDPTYSKSVDLDMYGRPWTISINSTQAFNKATSSNKPIFILLAGLLIDGLLLGLFISLVRANRKAIQLAHKMERQATVMLDNAGDGVCGVDLDGNIIFANKAVETLLGYGINTIGGKSFNALIHTPRKATGKNSNKDSAQAGDALTKTLQNGKTHTALDAVFWHKDGKPVLVSYTSAPIIEDKNTITGAVVVFKDITALKETEDFKNLVVESIPDLLFVKDKDFNIVQANSAFLSLYPENARDGVIGTTGFDGGYTPEEIEVFLKFDKRAFDEGYSETEETASFPSGEKRRLFTKKVRFYDGKGTPFILGIAHDITPIKNLHIKQEHLIERLSESNVELERFAYVASHDLQEPLRMVVNFTERLKIKYEDKLDDKARQYIGFAYDGALRMQQLIRDLLEYSRIGQDMNPYIEIDCNESLGVVLQNLKVAIEDTQADITSDPLPTLIWQPTCFSSMLQNIVGNALKYKADDRTPKINITVVDEGTHWKFGVADNGIGIKDEYQYQVFQTFRRLHTKKKYAGTGIGLSICKKIVESRGGKIWLESKYGKGSTFYFTVPKNIDDGVEYYSNNDNL